MRWLEGITNSMDMNLGKLQTYGHTPGGWASQATLVAKNPPASARDARDVGSIPMLVDSFLLGPWGSLRVDF